MTELRDVRGDGEPQAQLTVPVQVDGDDIVLTGFRTGWLSGSFDTENGTESFELDSGAGMGNPWMDLSIEAPDGSKWRERIDGRELVKRWLDEARARRTASDLAAVRS